MAVGNRTQAVHRFGLGMACMRCSLMSSNALFVMTIGQAAVVTATTMMSAAIATPHLSKQPHRLKPMSKPKKASPARVKSLIAHTLNLVQDQPACLVKVLVLLKPVVQPVQQAISFVQTIQKRVVSVIQVAAPLAALAVANR